MVAADHVNFYNTCDKEIHGPKMYFKPKLGTILCYIHNSTAKYKL